MVTRYRGVEYLRLAVRQRIYEEGLRPFSLRTGIPVGQLRSVVQGRAARSTTLESIAAVLDLEFYIGPPSGNCTTSPRLPAEITEALNVPQDASVADVVAAIDKGAVASTVKCRHDEFRKTVADGLRLQAECARHYGDTEAANMLTSVRRQLTAAEADRAATHASRTDPSALRPQAGAKDRT